VRDLYKKILVGIALFIAPQVFAENFKVLVIPDNVVTENIAVDSYIYNASAEFFADEIISLLNSTDYITSPTVSEIRSSLKQDPSCMISAKNLTSRFRTSYNIDFQAVKKLAQRSKAQYVLLMTSYVDAENYILRRTFWDFLNIPGASVIDPAYKISTYAVLVDTNNNSKIWADTFYKTISTCENRIITRGTSPQTEQLQKIKDYSRYLCPQIAQNVQMNILPENLYAKESKHIEYDLGNIDNVFTKKYRHLGKEYNKVYSQKKSEYNEFVKEQKQASEERKARKQAEMQSKLEVKATPLYGEDENINKINNKNSSKESYIKNTVFKKKNSDIQYPELIQIEIKKKKKNNLFGDIDTDRPDLRDYN